jgi:anti-sigma factor RsiW
MNCHEAAHLIDAYVDDELGAADKAAVVEHIEGCALCRQRVTDREWLRPVVRSMPYHGAPARVRTAVATASRQSSASRRPSQMLAWAAGIAIAVAGAGTLGLRARNTANATTALATEVLDRHITALASERVFEVRSSNQHTVKPWFQGKLDFSPPVPDLAAAGFPLVGGRVDVVEGRRIAALVYHRREHVIDVFVSPARGGVAGSDTRTIRGFNERHWVHADLSLWAVSDLNGRELAEFVQAFESSIR